MPAIASLVILQFLRAWNDLLVAVMTVTFSNRVSSPGGKWQVLMAAVFVFMPLPSLLFLALQRDFVQGIVPGSVRG